MSDRLSGVPVAVVGFGNQGQAQAEALRRAGVRVRVGTRPGGQSAARALALSFEVLPPAEAVRGARVAAVLVPDEAIPAVWPELVAAAGPDSAWVFAHGFALLYGGLDLGPAGDVVLVSPAAPGRMMTPDRPPIAAYLAVHQDRSGAAWSLAAEWAERLGAAPTFRTTVREETEVDLFGEQVVLCGGLNALVGAAFDTLVAGGYSPEIAYLECVHQLKYLADLLHERGMAGFRGSISRTALYGDLTRGPRVIGPESRAAMGVILREIQSGAFAEEWRAEAAAGAPRLAAAVAAASRHPIEDARRRAVGKPGT